ncbi:hypothetical protein AAEO57_10210 [Flavobacterium sp. DGU38]|uniref:Uncharacterized protein n=1 Tax=Flavobacterium calami TaxID=3139144 RepID=A0ABU9INY4_9FLAO
MDNQYILKKMTKDEITKEVKEIIALNSRYAFDEIKITDRVDKFITTFMKAKFARRIQARFDIPVTRLTNELHVSIKKVSQLVDFIDNIINQ